MEATYLGGRAQGLLKRWHGSALPPKLACHVPLSLGKTHPNSGFMDEGKMLQTRK